MAEHMIAALSSLGPSCFDKEHCARKISTQLILSVYDMGKKLVTRERDYLQSFVRTFLKSSRMPLQPLMVIKGVPA